MNEQTSAPEEIRKFDDGFAFRCYSEEHRLWNRLFRNRNRTLGSFVRELLNREAESLRQERSGK